MLSILASLPIQFNVINLFVVQLTRKLFKDFLWLPTVSTRYIFFAENFIFFLSINLCSLSVFRAVSLLFCCFYEFVDYEY